MGLGNFFRKLFGGGDDYQRRPGGGDYRKPSVGATHASPAAHGGPPPPPPAASRVHAGDPAYRSPQSGQAINDREITDALKHPYRRKRRSKHPLQGHIHETGSSNWFSPDRTTNPVRLNALGLPVLSTPVELVPLLGEELKRLYDFAYANDRDSEDSHYAYRLVPKKRGGWRFIEAPKPRLKAVQKRIKEIFVDKLPVSNHAHGFLRKRDMVSNATPHVGKACVICADISDFFPTIGFNRVAGFLRSCGYGRMVAAALAMLTTNAHWASADVLIGDEVVKNKDARKRAPEVFKYTGAYRRTPQGAPTSPGLANAICWRMDKRLAGLAKKFNAVYTRYADDLTFSGGVELAGRAGAFLRYVARIV
ncbi:MAG: RNA-directed DNA polymerase, partial [Planctomycetes bacterium]|nr:RNA-directed DNA polymerase [Planctomycetota bacterium]